MSREDHMRAFADLEAQMWISGGVASVVVNRAGTDLQGEMVTVFGVVEWKDRTDAKPQPEQGTQVAQAPPEPEPQQFDQSEEQAVDALQALAQQLGIPAEQIVDALAAQVAGENGHVDPPAETATEAVAAVVNPDGARDEPEEDVSSIPEHLR